MSMTGEHPDTTEEQRLIARQEAIRAAREEFNALWEKCGVPLSRFYDTTPYRIELLAWEFFLRGKGLKQ